MWFLILITYIFVRIEPVNLEGRGRAILRNPDNKSNPCEGIVEVYYNGTPGNVGDKFWSSNTENVVCNITHCGTPETSEDEYISYTNRKVWLNELNCSGTEESLWDCPGWPAPGLSFYLKPTVKKIKCSNNVKLSLTEHRCAGAVQFSTQQETGYFCGDNWEQKDAELLCKSLNCGGFKEFPNPEWMTENDFHKSIKMKINCSGIDPVDHLWQCATETSSTCKNPAFVVCEAYKRVQLKGNKTNLCSGLLEYEDDGKWKPVESSKETWRNGAETWCQQMHCGGGVSAVPANDTKSPKSLRITCADKVEVVLVDGNKENKCYGSVSIKVNSINKPVCASTWTDMEAKMVCDELKCGKMISMFTRSGEGGAMDYVKCTGSESSLWHCNAKYSKDGNIVCSTTPYVVCADSIDVKLADGPGRCAGRLEVYHEGRWKSVNSKTSKPGYSDLVCKQLGCGTTRSVGVKKFSKGSGDFLSLSCKANPQDISDCIKTVQSNQRDEQDAVGIICEEHELVFLKGNKSCSGTVMIEQGDRNYWLSGSNETWNQESANTVCQQMHCGNATNYTSEHSNDKNKDVWHKSYNCSSTKNSLFECDNYTSLPSDHNQTIAYVDCSGEIYMYLSNTCWGTVNIRAEEKYGGLCADTWTEERSKTLCSSLDCGAKVLPAIRQPDRIKPMFMSLHTTNHTTDLSQSNFVKTKDDKSSCTPAYVVCAGSIKPSFSSNRDKCFGNVEVYYEGKSIPVSSEALKDKTTQDAICKELKCGTAVKTLPYFGPTSAVNQVVTTLKCSSSDASLSACDISVQNNPTGQISLAGLQCSEWRTIVLEVQDTCKGDVVVYSKERRSLMSSHNWTHSQGQRLCEDMTCGSLLTNETQRKRNRLPLWNRTFSCPAKSKLKSVWDCETETPAPSQNQALHIECKDTSKVTLSGTCSGEVRINNIEICAQNWEIDYAHRVCQEMDCGNAISNDTSKKAQPRQKYFHVSCDDPHYRLGQCKRVQGECKTGLVSVFCIGNVKFNTTEKCGGVIKVNYRNKWENVCFEEFPTNLLNMLCQKINCPSKKPETTAQLTNTAIETSLVCPSGYDVNDIRYCVKNQSCTGKRLATIYCDGYERILNSPEEPPTPTVPIILGVGVLLIVVIIIVIYVRYYLSRRAKKKRFPSGMLPEEDMEFESEFQPEAEFIRDKDVHSISSIPYDDIDEVVESQPLTSQGSIAAGPRDNNMREGVLNLSDDGINYEVDESQENYDDIDACPEVGQTTAEVHEGTRTTPASDAAAFQDRVQKDDNYLVPGQDG
ncbi:scavenger receptor cysteine-rich type 1 protein M130 isoform X2 [Melanotaenia boesemani]|uniref:scavenger receptor cysteine-rich type 1 protein M130 isoform X2 n=1 Tax=Melanotaenia boesemani TaxID=1250792 RepID=UPI001C04B7CD|nr:scavenger receptor cysteine-rich type 1 protein M130 isoform X2 [Melanotaenia boesemani]